jgi:hypothetical protein
LAALARSEYVSSGAALVQVYHAVLEGIQAGEESHVLRKRPT